MTETAPREGSKAQRVLLTGARAPFTPGLARHLNDHEHRVVVADSLKFPITRFSRATAAFYRIPPPATQFEAFLQALIGIIRHERLEMLIPTCEEIFYIARGREALPPCRSVFADTLETLTTLHNNRHSDRARSLHRHDPTGAGPVHRRRSDRPSGASGVGAASRSSHAFHRADRL